MTSNSPDIDLSAIATHIDIVVKSSQHKEKLAKDMASALGAKSVDLYASFQSEIRKIAEDARAKAIEAIELANNEKPPQGGLDPDGSIMNARLTELAESADLIRGQLQAQIKMAATNEVRDVDEVVFARMVLDYIKNPWLGATCGGRSPGELYLVTKRIITAYATRDPYQAHYDVVSAFLTKWGDDNEVPDLCEDDRIRLLLAGELCRHTKAFKEKLAWPKDGAIDAAESMFWLDHAFAVYVETLGELGKDRASNLRQRSKARLAAFEQTQDHTNLWFFWFEEQKDESGKLVSIRSRFAETLTRILWNDVVKAEWERCRYDFPHLTHGSFATIIPALRPGNNVVVESIQNENRKKLVLYTSEGRLIAETSAIRAVAESAITMIRTGAEILSSTLGIMLTVREVAGFWSRHYNSGKDWQSWSFDSYEGLCTTFQINPHKHRHEVRQILSAQSNMNFTWPCGGTGSMINLFEGQGTRRTIRPTITANYPITPRYSWDIERAIGDTRFARTAKWKIPIPDPSEFPAVVGRRNEEAEQKVVFLVMMSKIAENARAGELVLTEEDWAHCANEAGVSNALASKTLHGWVAQGHLVRLPAGGWWLGECQARLADIIREGYVIADKGRKGISPPRKLRKGASHR